MVLGSLAAPKTKAKPRAFDPQKRYNFDWYVRASNVLPKLMAARAVVSPHHPDYVHWSEAIGHMQAILDRSITTNREANATFRMAQRAVLRAMSFTADAG